MANLGPGVAHPADHVVEEAASGCEHVYGDDRFPDHIISSSIGSFARAPLS